MRRGGAAGARLLLRDAELHAALALTAATATAATAVAALTGIPLAWALARRRFPGRWIVETLLDLPLVLLGGINKLQTAEAAIDEGFAFVALGRALLREPDLVNQWQAGTKTEGLCIHCNRCAPTIYSRAGTTCVVRDAVP